MATVSITPKAALIGLAAIIGTGAFLWWRGKQAGANTPLPLPDNGSGIPDGWSPTGEVIILRNAFNGFGTDEEAIFDALNNKTADQLIAIKNEYANRYHVDLLDEFNAELSGDDLQRALNYYNGII